MVSLWLETSGRQRLTWSSRSQFSAPGVGSSEEPGGANTHRSTCLVLGAQDRPCTPQRGGGAEPADVWKKPATHLLTSRSKAPYFMVSGERKWKNRRKTNQRMKGKGKSLSDGGYIVGKMEQWGSCAWYDLCIRSLPFGLSRNQRCNLAFTDEKTNAQRNCPKTHN